MWLNPLKLNRAKIITKSQVISPEIYAPWDIENGAASNYHLAKSSNNPLCKEFVSDRIKSNQFIDKLGTPEGQ